ncbi:MAG: glycoside hydrolase family 2 TIM barrel-domain containing protein [Ruthenibacterium sp.]
MKKQKALTPLLTVWGETIDKTCPLNDYPRPQMARSQWQCLNGLWDYAMRKDAAAPTEWDGKILVPFSPEAVLSGVGRQLLPGQSLWYRRAVQFEWPQDGEHLLLHFGAVDQHCIVFCNGKIAGSHSGGYWPFCFDITEFAVKGENILNVCVTDDSDTGDEAYGKQRLRRGGIWYTGQSGIWQTVWCETVPAQYIQSMSITPQYSRGEVEVVVTPSDKNVCLQGSVQVYDGTRKIAEGVLSENTACLEIPAFKSWSPEQPFLYTMKVTAGQDQVESYFGMREFSIIQGKQGNPCMALNGKPILQNGLLDQGYWSDGLYTAPAEDAIVWELEQIKAQGFNMLRKHIKVEPLRWYYHCDRIGLLVWQDFVSGGHPYQPLVIQYAPWLGFQFKDNHYKRFGRESEAGRRNFMRDAVRTMDLLYNAVGLCVWVPFNEGWGQFDAEKIARMVREKDPTRAIDHASGYHDQGAGDFHSYHIYYKRFRPKEDKMRRVLALTEFGGFSLAEKGHTASKKLFGYKIFTSKQALAEALCNLYAQDVLPQLTAGLGAVIYTQVSDVEDEINGLFSYDRKVMKPDADCFCKINEQLYRAFDLTK